MKIGSLVVFLGVPAEQINPMFKIDWLPKPLEEVLTIREFKNCEVTEVVVAFVEEGVIGFSDGEELGFPLHLLREIQPPEEGAMVIEEANKIEQPA